MAELNSYLKEYIDSNQYYHHLFTNIEENQINLIKEEIERSPFLDVILEFDDFYIIKELINTIPDNHQNRSIIEKNVIRDYVYFKIIEQAGLEQYDKEDLRKRLYSSNYEEYIGIDSLIWMFIDEDLRKAAKKTEGNKARCHFFIDSVDDIKLQYEINSLYSSRTTAVLMAYTTKDKLLTYTSSFGDFIEHPHDYQRHNVKEYK